MTVGVRRAPLLLAAALVAVTAVGPAAGPAAADKEPWRDRVPVAEVGPVPSPRVGRVPSPRPVPKVSVRRPEPPKRPKGVTVGPTVKVPRVSVQRSPWPRVSISMPKGKRRAKPEVVLPHVTIYRDGVCSRGVQIGECPRRRPHAAPSAPPGVPQVPPTVVPPVVPVQVVPPPRPTPTPTPSTRAYIKSLEPPARRRNPMNTVLLTVALVTAITSTTAVAFRARR